MANFNDRFQKYSSTVYPGMVALLAAELGVAPEAVEMLGVGFDYKCQAWVIPERNALGDITGLSFRYDSGRKTMAPGGGNKRGLVYPFNQEFDKGAKRFAPGKHNWTRVAEAGVTCPICGKPDGCLVSAADIYDPPAAICIRPEGKNGAKADLGNGNYLHVLKAAGRVSKAGKMVLPETDLPIIIVEGASDALAAMSLGFVAIGRPNYNDAGSLLSRMPLAGHEVWVIGDNDAGAGEEGMEATAAVVAKMTPNVKRALPPAGMKDLRMWYQSGLTAQELTEYMNESKTAGSANPDIFPDDQPSTVAEAFLERNFVKHDTFTLRSYAGTWYEWKDGCYNKLEAAFVEGDLLRFMRGKQCMFETMQGSGVRPVPMTTKSLNDIKKNLNIWCPIPQNPPAWLNGKDRTMPEPKDLIAFKNGILDINKYMEDEIVLYPLDPSLFIMNTFPYDFDEDAECPLAEKYFKQVLNGDEDVINLIQEWFGYCLVPDTTQEKMMLLTGRPRSGKSTTLDMMRAMLGQEQVCALQMSNLTSRFGRHPMLGKLAATFGDAKTPRAGEASVALENLLSIIGQDAISIDRKGRDELANVKLFCRFTMVMNDLPSFSDHARALAPRMNIIYYPNSYVGKENRKIKPELERMAGDGMLINWALRGLKRLRENGCFTEPTASLRTMKQFENTTTPVMAFVDECCSLVDMGYTEDKDTVYDMWHEWCRSQGRKPGMKAEFSKWLLNACSSVKACRHRVGGKHGPRVQVYKGLTLLPAAKKRYLD